MSVNLDTRNFPHLTEVNSHVYERGAIIFSDGLKNGNAQIANAHLEEQKKVEQENSQEIY